MTTRPYELLARFGNDGNVAGVSIRTITTLNGRDYENDPTPLSGTSDPAFVSFAQQFSASVVAERDASNAALATITTERDSLQTQLDAANATIASLQSQLGKPSTEVRPGPDYLYPYEFRSRFTPESRARIRAAVASNDQLADYWDTLFLVRWVVVTDPATIEGVQALALLGLIAPDRVQEILAPIGGS